MFCVAFLCAISLLIGMDFAPYMPVICFVIFIYLKEQEGKDELAIANGNKERLEAMSKRKYLLSRYSFIKIGFFIVTLALVVPLVSALFAGFVPGYGESFKDEITRNYCMPGMLLSLPVIRFYNGSLGISNRFTKIVFRVYYLMLLILIVMIKIFFLYDYSILSSAG